MSRNYVQGKDYRLAGSGVAATDTSIVLTSMQLPNSNALIAMSDFGDIGFITFEPETSREENASFTGITQNVNGTATLTGVTRGLTFVSPSTTDTALRKSHSGGSIVRVSNSVQFYENLANKYNTGDIKAVWTFNATADAANPIIDDADYVPSNDEYIVKKYATTQLPNDTTFINNLTSNSTFQTAVNNFVTGGGGGAASASIEQTFDYTDFVDDGSGNGIASFAQSLPEDAVPIGVVYQFTSGFDAASTMAVLESNGTATVIGGTVDADAVATLVGVTDGNNTAFDFDTNPNPVVFMLGVIPTQGQVKVTVLYGSAGGGASIVSVANQDLTAGQTVGISNLGGGVAIANRAKYAFTLPDTAQAAEYVPLGSDRVFILYKVNGVATLKGIVGTVDRDTMEISVGSAVSYTTSLQGTIFEVALLDTDKVAVVYTESGAPKDLKIHVSTISGTTITANAQQAIATTTNDVNSIRLTKVATDKVALYTAEASTLNPLIRAITVSGTTLGTVGTAVTCIQVNAMVSHDTDALSMFGNANATVDDTLQIATISGTTITVGTAVTVNTVNTNVSDNKLCVVDSTHIALSYRGAPGGGLRVASISGTVPTLGTFVSSGIGGAQASVFYDSGRALVMYGIGKYYTLSGTTLTLAIGGVGSSWADTGSSVSNFVNMGTYYAVIDVTSSANNITIQGMSTIFTGFAAQTVSRGANVAVTIKGQVSGQTGLYAGYNYTANGTGGLTQLDAGIVTAVTSTMASL